MTKIQKPIVHGRDHERGGADPIRIVWESDGDGDGAAWIEATLINDWTGSAFYRRSIDGVVELAGTVGGGVDGTVAFVLPAGYRPDADIAYLAAYDLGGGDFNAARVTVNSADGGVTVWYPMT